MKNIKLIEDINSKILKLKEGKIKKYEVYNIDQIKSILDFCRLNNIMTFIKVQLTPFYYKLYSIEDYFKNIYEFNDINNYYINKQKNNNCYIYIFKGYKSSGPSDFIFYNRYSNIFS